MELSTRKGVVGRAFRRRAAGSGGLRRIRYRLQTIMGLPLAAPVPPASDARFPSSSIRASKTLPPVAVGPQHRESILYVTSEMADYVKAGGLGEVSAALPRALRGHYDVRILVPGYREIVNGTDPITRVGRLPGAFGLPSCDLGRIVTKDGLTIYVLLCPELYDREGSPYGDERGIDWSDNDVRFARLGLAAADLACGLGDPQWRPDLLHLNDWPASLAPAYLAWRGLQVPSILTIHNLAYQGLFEPERMPRLGIPDT